MADRLPCFLSPYIDLPEAMALLTYDRPDGFNAVPDTAAILAARWGRRLTPIKW